MTRSLRLAFTAAAVGALALSACTAGGGSSSNGPSAGAKQTITVWHGFTGDNEVNAFNAAVARFHAKFPNITVNSVKGQDDDKITKAISGGDPPDVALSFTTDNVGKFCATGAWQDLTGLMKDSGVSTSEFNPASMQYTQFDGKRCALPLLQDVYGLYYNKTMLAQAGYTSPPKTISELTAMTKKLTTFNPDGSIKTAGFIPDWNYYEVAPVALRTVLGCAVAGERQVLTRHRPGLGADGELAEVADRLVRLREAAEVPPVAGSGVQRRQPVREVEGRDGDRR